MSALMAKWMLSAIEKALRIESSVADKNREGIPAAVAASTVTSPPMIRSALSSTAWRETGRSISLSGAKKVWSSIP